MLNISSKQGQNCSFKAIHFQFKEMYFYQSAMNQYMYKTNCQKGVSVIISAHFTQF